MREYPGHFEVHLTARAGGADAAERFAGWCRGRGLKCVRIVLARGEAADQPMATWRRSSTTLSAVVAEAHRLAGEAAASGHGVVRVKVEADPHNVDVPSEDAEAAGHDERNYFECHVKIRRAPDAPREALLGVCERNGAHLSRNAFRDGGGVEERFVTQRGYACGLLTAAARLGALMADLDGVGEEVVEHETEYCVYDTNLRLDDGWLPDASR